MDVLTPIVTGAMLAVFTVVLHLLIKVQIDGLKDQIIGVKGQISGLKDRIDQLQAEIGLLRSDLTQVALAVGANVRPQTG